MPTPTTRLSTLPPRENPGIEIVHQRSEKLFLKLALGGIFGFLFLIALFWVGHRFYVHCQEKRLTQQAETAMRMGDTATASLAARALLQIKPDSLPAQRIAASIAEHAGDPNAVVWRQKIVQTKEHSVEDVLALAQTALQFNDVVAAKSAIGAFSEFERQTAAYHAVTAMIAQANKQNDKAITEWEQAVRLEPNDKNYQLQLGSAQFRSNDPGRRQLGEAVLNGLRSDEKYRTAATRILITEGAAQHQTIEKIRRLASDLTTYSDTTYADRLLVADVFRQTKDEQFTSLLTDLEKRAADRPQDLAALLSWMSAANLNVFAMDFIRTLKPELLQAWPVPLALADVYVRLNEWNKLEAATKTADWHTFDFLRHAYLARALREQDKPAAAQSEWAAATKGAGVGSEQTMALLRTASSWGWRDQEVELLWSLTKRPEKQKEALQTLYRFYINNHDTQGLYRALVRLTAENPTNLDIQNNLAQISLLLDVNTDEARRIAAAVYEKDPTNAAYITTHAYALLTKDDTNGATKVLASLTDEQLKDPAIAAYYGICLAELNDPRASKYLEIGKDALLLPEEKTLIEKARAQVATHTEANENTSKSPRK